MFIFFNKYKNNNEFLVKLERNLASHVTSPRNMIQMYIALYYINWDKTLLNGN